MVPAETLVNNANVEAISSWGLLRCVQGNQGPMTRAVFLSFSSTIGAVSVVAASGPECLHSMKMRKAPGWYSKISNPGCSFCDLQE